MKINIPIKFKNKVESNVENNYKFILVLVSTISLISFLSWYHYYSEDLTLAYNDARSHLNISRRVVDNLNPGIAQIGSVWLPLQHVLQLITIKNDLMFRSGLSGSLLSMLSFIGSGLILFLICRQLNLNYKTSLLATVTFVLNQNMLYMQTTPMTESLLIFTFLSSVYYLLRWEKYGLLKDLILCSLFSFLASLTRYDGWILCLYIACAIYVIALIKYNSKKAESNTILYSVLALFGIFLWFGWNLLIFRDPLYFSSGQYSAKAQQDILFQEGRLFTKHNLFFSIETYFYTIKENTGIFIFLIGGLGIIIFFLNGKFSLTTKLVIGALFTPIIFNILSLYLGQSVIHLPYLPPYTFFNVRYGLMALPLLSVGIVMWFPNKLWSWSILFVIIILASYLMVKPENIITIEDATKGSSAYFLDDSGNWLATNATDGLILVAAASNDSLIFTSNLPLKNFITEGTGNYWSESLNEPSKYAKYVIIHSGDAVSKAMENNSDFIKNYIMVYDGEFSQIYEKI